MTDFIANISIIMLNMNELNPPVKRQRLSDQIKKKKIQLCCLHFKYEEIDYKQKWEKDMPCRYDQKKAGLTVLISDQDECRAVNIFRDKKGHCIKTKVSIFKIY